MQMLSIKKLLLIMFITTSSMSVSAQNEIRLIEPSKLGGLSMMETLWNRHSDREFSNRMLSEQDLSDLLFAASGINRPAEGKITAPSALNTQEIDLYLFGKNGVYKYVPDGHLLNKVADGDSRAILAGTPQFSQDFVMDAPVVLLLVANPQKFEAVNEQSKMMAITDAGIMSENICLFCASRGMAVVPRATMDSDAVAKLLNLHPQAISVLNLPVGYPKK